METTDLARSTKEESGRLGSQHHRIVEYYDECEVDFRIVWHLKNHFCLHYGYWEADTKRLRDALHLMDLRLSELAQVSGSDEVLDAGCGVGGSAIFLAEQYGCRVHGVTLSEKQAARARENAAGRGLETLTRFDRRDFCRSELPDESYDVVWAVESVCHVETKSDFLNEAYRLLKRGGRLIVADFFQTNGASTSPQFEFVQKWADCWAVPGFATVLEFVASMERLGFRDIEVRDVSDHVRPTVRRLFYTFVPGLICSSALHLIGRRTARQWANTWSTYYQYKAFESGLWHYRVVTAGK